MKLNKIFLLVIIFMTAVVSQELFAEEWVRILNLRGYWKFSIGDDKNWALPNYNDSDWDEIRVPSTWEDEGFHGYNGYAWYRKSFEMPSGIVGDIVYLEVGRVDDVDEVYVNGNLVGHSGIFPPDFETAYSSYRKYPVPIKFLKPKGKNVIAVRVYDSELGGGIYDGNPGFYVRPYTLIPDVSFEGEWKFKTGDNMDWKEPGFNDKDWRRIVVPGLWDTQGYGNYDGFGWYRFKFNAPAKLKDKKLVLLVGRVDDIDEVYLNGQLIGSTGNPSSMSHTEEYQQFRGYFLPPGVLKINQENVIAVRVYDGFMNGGIYEGPIGLITQEKYTKFWRDKKSREKKNIFDIWFNE